MLSAIISNKQNMISILIFLVLISGYSFEDPAPGPDPNMRKPPRFGKRGNPTTNGMNFMLSCFELRTQKCKNSIVEKL
jgi:hypothetical protein